MRLVLSLVCALALVAFARAGDDTKKDVTLKGEICCAKCELKKQDKCKGVVIIKKKEQKKKYYFYEKARQVQCRCNRQRWRQGRDLLFRQSFTRKTWRRLL